MSNFTKSIYQLKCIDDIGRQENIIKQINPLSKLIVTVLYIFTVVSMDKYDISALLPFLFYQVLLLYLTEIPIKLIAKLSVVGLPLVLGMGLFNLFLEVLGMGLFNLFLDRKVFIYIGFIPITYGVISFTSLLIKGCLTVTAGGLLICTMSIEDLAKALRKLHVPKLITSQLVFMYRYIFILIESVEQVNNAYMLRAPNQKGINFKVWGSLLGQLLLRSFDKAERIYNAMILRGFNGEYVSYVNEKLKITDFIYILSWIVFLLTVKYINLPLLIRRMIVGR